MTEEGTRRLAVLLTTVTIIALAGLAIERFPQYPTPPQAPPPAARVESSPTLSQLEIRFHQGVLMLHAKQYEHAAAAFHWVLLHAPTRPEAHVNMGFALLGLQRYREAADFFTTAMDLNPRQRNSYYGLAEALEGVGDLMGALGAMESYIHTAQADDPFLRKAQAAVWTWRAEMESRAVKPAEPVTSQGEE